MQLFKKLFYKPQSIKLTVSSSNGFHLRPVAKFVHTAKKFACDITAISKEKEVDAKTVNTLLSLSLEEGDTFTLTLRGKDASKARKLLKQTFETLMSNDVSLKTLKKAKNIYASTTIEGDIICKGIAIAPCFNYQTQTLEHVNNLTFKDALTQTSQNLLRKYEREKEYSSDAEIYLAQKELLDALGNTCETLTDLEGLIAKESTTLKATKLEAKISDYNDILQQVKNTLGIETKLILPKEPYILIADDLLPSEVSLLAQSNIQGVLLRKTSINSHTAILLRAEGIPSLIIDNTKIPLKDTLILDASSGVVIPSPSKEEKEKAQIQQQEEERQKQTASSKRLKKALTSTGKSISVYANIGDENSAKVAKKEGAEGIGLLRSEFLFKTKQPSLKTQTQAYENIFALFETITVRTLDIGGDKALPYVHLPHEKNPFLGIRGVRLFKTHLPLLEEQLHAILLASKNKKINIMFPMVSTVEEFTYAKETALKVSKKHKIDISHISFGIMIEVPSVLFLIESFNEVVDFYSIGTNDLSQYLFATERTHPTLKVDALSPVIFSVIKLIIDKATKPVSICGELAANSDAIDKLIKIGVETLSVNPKSIAQTKETIRHV